MQIALGPRVLTCSSGGTEVCESIFESGPLCLMLFKFARSA